MINILQHSKTSYHTKNLYIHFHLKMYVTFMKFVLKISIMKIRKSYR